MRGDNYATKVNAGPPQPPETIRQQRGEALEQLADIFACIFDGLTPEEQANYMTVDEARKAA
jgi:hypothetical protein